MATEHTTHFVDATKMEQLENGSVNLVVTSPPYPMVEMWDEIFAKADSKITKLLAEGDGWGAFERMHKIMDKIWAECHRVTSAGGFVCINIGDATRTIDDEFALYTNRARIDTVMIGLGFTPLPSIIWQKVSNSPTAFMGSGMLPAGAYVAHGHEHILIYRKGGKRQFKSDEEKLLRRDSAYFWEERNAWFSDVWTFTGTNQNLGDSADRKRSAAYPFELPFRIIAMYSVKGDTVLDPFMGTGSTHAAAIALGRNSVGYEIDASLKPTITKTKDYALEWGRARQQNRLDSHSEFVEERLARGKSFKHFNKNHRIFVMTKQETELIVENLPSKQGVLFVGRPVSPHDYYIKDKEGKKGRWFRHEFILNGINQRGSSLTGRNFVDSPPDLFNEIEPEYYDEWVTAYFQKAIEQKKNGKPVTPEKLGILADKLRERVEKNWENMDFSTLKELESKANRNVLTAFSNLRKREVMDENVHQYFLKIQ